MFIRTSTCERKAEEGGLGRGGTWPVTQVWQSLSQPVWSCGTSSAHQRALHLAWLSDTLTLFIHLRKSMTLGQSNSLQLKQTFKELAAGGYLLMAFLISAQNVLPWRRIWMAHLFPYHARVHVRSELVNNAKLVSKVVAQSTHSTHTTWGFPLLLILTNSWYC